MLWLEFAPIKTGRRARRELAGPAGALSRAPRPGPATRQTRRADSAGPRTSQRLGRPRPSREALLRLGQPRARPQAELEESARARCSLRLRPTRNKRSRLGTRRFSAGTAPRELTPSGESHAARPSRVMNRGVGRGVSLCWSRGVGTSWHFTNV